MRFLLKITSVLFLCFSCILNFKCSQSYSYSISIRSEVNEKIFDANVSFLDVNTGGGIISQNTESAYCCISSPIPENVEVSWKTSEGLKFIKTIKVASFLPDEFNPTRDTIKFIIKQDNSVVLSFELWTGKYTTKEVLASEVAER